MKAFTKFVAATCMAGALICAAPPVKAAVMVFTDLSDFLAVLSTVQVEDFEGAPWDPAGFKAQPVEDGGLFWTSSNYFFVTNSVANSTTLSVSDFDDFNLPNDLTDLLSVQLQSGITAVGIFVSSLGQSHGVQIRAFDASGGLLLDATSEPTGPSNFDFIGLVSLLDIYRVDFVSTQGPPQDDFAIDDFHYGVWNFGQNATSNDVAEPAALVLFASALLVVGCVARRRPR